MRIWVVLAACLGVVAMAGQGRAADPALAVSLSYNGSPITLNHVLIVRHDNQEFPDQLPVLSIILSDQDIPLTVAAGPAIFPVIAYARQNSINAVEIQADPEGVEKRASLLFLRAPGIEPGVSVSTALDQAFSALSVTEDHAAGSLAMAAPGIALTASFDAPVNGNAVTSELAGAPAIASAQTRALMACAGALKTGDRVAMAKLYTPEEFEFFDGLRNSIGEAQFHEMTHAQPGPIDIRRSVTRVLIRNAVASVVMSTGAAAYMVFDGTSWRCG